MCSAEGCFSCNHFTLRAACAQTHAAPSRSEAQIYRPRYSSGQQAPYVQPQMHPRNTVLSFLPPLFQTEHPGLSKEGSEGGVLRYWKRGDGDYMPSFLLVLHSMALLSSPSQPPNSFLEDTYTWECFSLAKPCQPYHFLLFSFFFF